jgi:TonB family protein
MLRIFIIFACFSAVNNAQSPQVFRAGEDVMPPRVIERTAPEYTDEARQAKLEGAVGLRLIVNPEGVPEDIYVMHSLGFGLDKEALDAVRNWRFAPGMKDGKTVAVLTSVDVPFHLLSGRADWHLARASFDLPKGVTLPAVETAHYPEASGSERHATVSLAFDIDPAGQPVNIHATGSSDSQWEQELIAMLAEWRFHPAQQDGVAVTSSATFDFERGRAATS